MKNDKPSRARKIYNRNARLYNIMESPMELLGFRRWRELVFQHVSSSHFLEIGVGTGKNFGYYPSQSAPTAIDFSENMLKKAKQEALRRKINVDLRLMDVEHMEFADNAFDTVVATFVFCSVPDPLAGLREICRVCRMDGSAVFLEHVRPGGRLRGKLFDWLNPSAVRLTGANINRMTVENIKNAGFEILEERNLFSDIVKFIRARPGR